MRKDGRHADRGPGRWHRRRPVPSRRARACPADRRRGHRGGQRRRRRAPARAADLPRPGQRDVHAGRRRATRSAAGAASARPGWSRRSCAAYGVEPTWFGLGDKDIATHLVRTRMLDAGYPLSAVTEALCDRWQPGRPDAAGHRRPGGDARGGRGGRRAARAIHFQEWWVGYRGDVPDAPVRVRRRGRRPSRLRACWRRSRAADVVLVAPSNPVVSIAPILAVPPLREAVADGPAPVVGVSPIIGGAPVRGMADKCLAALGVEVQRGRRRRAVRRPRGRRRCSTAGWSTRPTTARRCPASTVRAGAAVDDGRGRHRRDGRGGARAARRSHDVRRLGGPAGARHRRRTARRRPGRADRQRRALAARRRRPGGHQQDRVARPRAGSSTCRPTGPSARPPRERILAAETARVVARRGRPRSCRRTTGS